MESHLFKTREQNMSVLFKHIINHNLDLAPFEIRQGSSHARIDARIEPSSKVALSFEKVGNPGSKYKYTG